MADGVRCSVADAEVVIELSALSKKYGDKTVVSDLTAVIRPGHVTGFLGPNGAGKSTTMRMVLGLDRPTSGQATVNGHSYRALRAPLREVGALLNPRSVHPKRTARAHLRALAAAGGVPTRRVDEVLELAGITGVADKPAGGFSLGMTQRLGVASALLGDPGVVILDEPVNGLDPDGVLWIRTLTRRLAAEGRTVLVSSHLMSEMSLTATHLLVIGRGRLLADTPMADFIAASGETYVRLRSPRLPELIPLIEGPDTIWSSHQVGEVHVRGLGAAEIGDRAAAAGVPLHELTVVEPSLEAAFMKLTRNERDYRADAQEDPR